MAKNPFKEGDRVYVYPYGWTTVEYIDGEDVMCHAIEGVSHGKIFMNNKFVSFTEYDPIKGGLSHERPDDKQFVDAASEALAAKAEDIKRTLDKNCVWSPIQSMTLDAIGEKLQEHDRVLKGVSAAIDELKNTKVTAKIKLEDIWPIKPAFKQRFNSGGETGERVLTSEQSRYRSLIKDFMSDFDVVGFNAYDELYEATNKDGSLSPGISTGRVTLSIDLVRRK